MSGQKTNETNQNIASSQPSSPVSLDYVHKRVTNLEKETKEYEREFKRAIETDKTALITIFGLYASITAFLTIEIQFLKGFCDVLSVIGFSLMLCSLLCNFNLALDYLVTSRINKNSYTPNYVFIFFNLLLLFAGATCIYYGREEQAQKNEIYQEYAENFKEKTKTLFKEIEILQKQIASITHSSSQPLPQNKENGSIHFATQNTHHERIKN